MKTWYLKFCGFALWGAFLFVPFIAHADQGFDIYLPLPAVIMNAEEPSDDMWLDHFPLGYDGGETAGRPAEEWTLRFNAGKDTVLTDDFSDTITHDRLPLDDGEREAFRFGLGLNYTF